MSHIENMKAALSCKQPADAVPIWELEFHAWDNASGRHVVFGSEFSALTPREKEKTMHANAEIMISVCEKLRFSALTTPTCHWETAPGVPAYYWIEDEYRHAHIEILKQYCDAAGIFLIGNCQSLICMPSSADNYEEFCYMLIDRPGEMDTRADKLLEHGLETAKRWAGIGIGAIVSPSDIADNRGLFYNPAQLDRWFFPHLEKWAQELKKLGLFSILHTDGNINAVLERLAASSLNALQAIDPIAGMKIADVKAETSGRLCLCGNIESGLLMNGPLDEIYRQTKEVMDACKPGGGFVLGASNACYAATPLAHYEAMIRAWKDCGGRE